ncbi:MAG TPA: phenylalanine--tRNA ligase subunit beta [Candidatus Polarisedimenticolaceae bacterium]|nr:phenylalanine--tRNA ligase subunit beta [Candidatus Polarisedimenticolaceae bacterium]
MLISSKWVKALLGAAVSVPAGRELASILTERGLPVDTVVDDPREGPVLDVDVPANRPDCLGHLGVARELAAHRGVPLPSAAGAPPGSGPGVETAAAVTVEDPAGSPRFTATLVRGIRVGPSPHWVVARLEACGLRSISNAVDVSNLVMLELGQPIHFYDLRTLLGTKLVVRRGRTGERLTTLDGIERTLDPDVLVIADGERAVGLAGIMGGAASGIGEGTTDVLVEAASFDPGIVRRAARRLGIASDAAYRFERGVDPNAVHPAQDLALRLLVELCGGNAAPGRIEVGSAPAPATLRLRQSRTARLLGYDPGAEEIRRALAALSLRPEPAEEGFAVTVPSWRKDLAGEVDLVEEVARHLGYGRVPERRPNRISPRAGRGEPPLDERARDVLAQAGFHEMLSYAMVSAEDDALTARSEPPASLRLLNPMSEAQAVLRRSLLPGLLRAADQNLRRGVRDVRLFEVGHVFSPREGGIAETARAGFAWAGAGEPRHWSRKAAEVSFPGAAGLVDAVLAALRGGAAVERRPASLAALHPGQTAEWIDGAGEVVARAGLVHPDVARRLDLPAPIFLGEVELGLLARTAPAPVRGGSVPRVPAVWRDLALVLPVEHTWAEVAAVLRSVPAPEKARFEVVDRYAGPPLPQDRISLTVRVILQPLERSLTEAQIEGFRRELIETLQARMGVALRA